MKPELIERLNQINREFYARFAAPFSETRPETARDLDRILPYIADGARVLDVGCGNGRLATLLFRQRHSLSYTGIDSSEQLVKIAQGAVKQDTAHPRQFIVADITRPDWRHGLSPDAMPFDCVLMLSILHHIPGGDVRARILRQMAALLAPQGCAVVSTWQFMQNERMRRKIVPWSRAGIDERELEPGDALLDWKRGGTGLRYCHWIGEDELRTLARGAGWTVLETFRAGGREGDLSLYAILSLMVKGGLR